MSDDRDEADSGRDRDGETRTPSGDAPGGERERRESSSSGGTQGDAPLSGLRADIEERRQRRASSTPDVDDVFEEASSEPVVDGEQVWEDLLEDPDETAGVLAFGDPVDDESADVTVIPNSVCHSCTYFGDPPELHCTNEGTTIRRMVDMDHYEVVDCPVVKKRSDLQN